MGLLGDVLRCLSPLIVTGSLLGNGVMMLMHPREWGSAAYPVFAGALLCHILAPCASPPVSSGGERSRLVGKHGGGADSIASTHSTSPLQLLFDIGSSYSSPY